MSCARDCHLIPVGCLRCKALRYACCRGIDVLASDVCAPSRGVIGLSNDKNIKNTFKVATSCTCSISPGMACRLCRHTALYSLSPGHTRADSPINVNVCVINDSARPQLASKRQSASLWQGQLPSASQTARESSRRCLHSELNYQHRSHDLK